MLSFILWDASPALFTGGGFSISWYTILVILGVVAGRQVFLLLNRKDSASEGVVLLMLLLSLVLSRFFYVIFNTPAILLKRPWEALLPIEMGKGVHFTGLASLSGYGALAGIIIVCWAMRNRIPNANFMQLMARSLTAASLVVVFLSVGLFLNGETEGDVTNSSLGVVTTYPVSHGLTKVPCCIMRTPGGKNPLTAAGARKGDHPVTPGHQPVQFYLFFRSGATEQTVKEFIIGDVKEFLFFSKQFVSESGVSPVDFSTLIEGKDTYVVKIKTQGIARHPVNAYTALGSLILFVVLYWMNRGGSASMRIAGMFFCINGLLQLLITFARNYRSPSSQWISVGLAIILVVAGVIMILRSQRLANAVVE